MKISELSGSRLDSWVAKALRQTLSVDDQMRFMPSTDWSQGGPIIEREEIAIRRDFADPDDPDDYLDTWLAYIRKPDLSKGADFEGETPLIAAMRAFVASKFGDKVVDK